MALVHSLNRLHRDLKSGNILAALVHGQVRLKVADFGTATLAGLSLHVGNETADELLIYPSHLNTQEVDQRSDRRLRTQLTKGIGTPLWMAPEVLSGRRYGPPADVYSYAIVLWEIAAHSEPWPEVTGGFLSVCTELRTKLERGE